MCTTLRNHCFINNIKRFINKLYYYYYLLHSVKIKNFFPHLSNKLQTANQTLVVSVINVTLILVLSLQSSSVVTTAPCLWFEVFPCTGS